MFVSSTLARTLGASRRARSRGRASRRANPSPLANPMLWFALAGAGALFLWSRTSQGSVAIQRAIEVTSDAITNAAEEVMSTVESIAGAPRGIRNNNPGNIDRTADRWQGMSPDQSSDSRFVVFDSPLWGIRALARVLMNYAKNYGADTIAEVIARWAPSNENDTQAYINSVAAATGIGPNQQLTDADLPGVVAAIIKHENGMQPYAPELIAQAVALARSA